MSDSDPASNPTPQTHPQFNEADADITIQSSDSVLFQVHRKNLETHTGAFPGAEFASPPGEVTLLTEPASVLALLFQFVYPRRQPDLDNMEFECVAALAEAVEKYDVFAAMKVCEIRLRQFLPEHAAEILSHAITHDYPKLVEAAVPCLARKPLTEMVETLPLGYVDPWCRYHEAWRNAFKSATTYVNANQSPCPTSRLNNGRDLCRGATIVWILEMENIDTLPALERALDMASKENDLPCRNCGFENGAYGVPAHESYISQAARVCQEEIKAIPSFSTFLRG